MLNARILPWAGFWLAFLFLAAFTVFAGTGIFGG
jgi:hypothetical protein